MTKVLDALYPALEPTPKQMLERYNAKYFKKRMFEAGGSHSYCSNVLKWIAKMDKEPENREKILDDIHYVVSTYGGHALGQEILSIDPISDRIKFDLVIKKYFKKIKDDFFSKKKDDLTFTDSHCAFFNKLGFSAKKFGDTVIFTIPSIAKLQEIWKTLRHDNPDFPELTIYSSDGIASDLEFVEAYMLYDVTVSTGIERVHDFIHLYDVIRLIKQNPQFYKTQKEAIVQEVKNVYEKIIFAKNNFTRLSEELKISELSIRKLEISLGAAVDFISSYRYFETTINNENDFLKFMTDLWQTPVNKEFFQKRLDPEDETIDFTLSEIKTLLALIDAQMKTSPAASSEP